MSETPDQLLARARGALRVPPVQEWDTWPFEGEAQPRPLAPLTPEPALRGQGGVDCWACATPDSGYRWAAQRWRLTTPPERSGLPVVVLLMPREHFASPADLPEDLAREQGVMLGRVERAVLAVGGIARVHICRWGEGSEHLHWWFLGRPAGFGQLRSSFTALWDDVLPPTPHDVWEANLDRVVRELDASR